MNIKIMLKKLSRTTNFILIGIVIGLFIGVSIRQALGDETFSGTVRADNLTVNTSRIAGNGLAVDFGNLLVPNGNVGIGTTTPTTSLDVVGDISVSADGKDIGIKVWSGNLVVLEKVGIGVSSPAEKLDIQGNIRSAGYIKTDSLCIGNVDGVCVGNSKKLCIGATCIDEAQLKAMMSGGGGGTGTTGGTVTSGTMTGTGTSSDPYKCPFTYTVIGSGLPGGSCVNRSDVIDACCKSGSMTSCEPISGGVSIVGSGCHYIPPESQPQKHLEAAVDHGLEYIQYGTAFQGGANGKAREVGSDCGSEYEFYHDPITVSGVPNTLIKFLTAAECGDAGSSCFQGHRSTQACK